MARFIHVLCLRCWAARHPAPVPRLVEHGVRYASCCACGVLAEAGVYVRTLEPEPECDCAVQGRIDETGGD